MLHWYALHTKPHKEALVQDLLASRGIQVYLPTLPVERRTRSTTGRPFFSRYLFAHLDLTETPVSSINWCQGMAGVVSFGGQPAIVPDEVLRWLQTRIAQMSGRDHYSGLPLLPNTHLRVNAGPLKGAEAIFDRRLSGADRARVFILLLGRLTAAEIPLSWLSQEE